MDFKRALNSNSLGERRANLLNAGQTSEAFIRLMLSVSYGKIECGHLLPYETDLYIYIYVCMYVCMYV